MMRQTTTLLAYLFLYGFGAPSHAAEISGAWKIDTQGGPTPLCSLVQVGSNLNGSCVGPQAKGTITGTLAGPTVQWRWQWITYAGNGAGAFDFVGVLRADNSISGTIERKETGFLLNFTAKRQIATAGPSGAAVQAPPESAVQSAASAPDQGLNPQSVSANANQPDYNPTHGGDNWQALAAKQPASSALTSRPLGPVRSTLPPSRGQSIFDYVHNFGSPQATTLPHSDQTGYNPVNGMQSNAPASMPYATARPWNATNPDFIRSQQSSALPNNPTPEQIAQFNASNGGLRQVGPGPFDQFDPQDVATANAMFPWATQQREKLKWLADQKNIRLDRQQGNSYSIGVRLQ
jgi:hypothetical protein